MPNLAALALACLLAAPDARELRLWVAPDLGCGEGQIQEALARRFGSAKVALGPAVAGQPSLRLTRAADGRIELALAEGPGQATAHRTLSPTDRCVDVAETVALLTEAWLQQLPWRGEGLLPEVPALAASPSGPPGPPAPAKPEPASVAAPPAVPVSKISVTPEVVHPAAAAAPAAQPRPSRVTVQLGGGGSLDGNAKEPGYLGSASIEVAVDPRRRFGVGLDFELQSGLSAQDGNLGSLSVQRQALRLFGRYAFDADRGLRLLAGLGAERYAATATGFTTTSDVAPLDPELWLAALWLQPLPGVARRFYVFARAALSVELQSESFYVTQGTTQDTLLTLSPLWATLAAGLGARLF